MSHETRSRRLLFDDNRGKESSGDGKKKKIKKEFGKAEQRLWASFIDWAGFRGKRAWTEMQIWPGCPLAFYRINVRPIRRTTIFNGSSHNGLLCAVKARSLGGRGPTASRKCDPDKSGIASRRSFSTRLFR